MHLPRVLAAMATAVVVGTAAAISGPAAPARAAARHTVKKGETLSLIARHYRVPMRRIMAANGLKDANKIRSGMTLIIPAD